MSVIVVSARDHLASALLDYGSALREVARRYEAAADRLNSEDTSMEEIAGTIKDAGEVLRPHGERIAMIVLQELRRQAEQPVTPIIITGGNGGSGS